MGIYGTASPGRFAALVAYTTSRPWTSAMHPPGVFAFDQQEAATFGQTRAFVLDLRRQALMPITSSWFPWLDQTSGGIQGRASSYWQRRFKQMAEDLIARRPEIIERLGPLWPPRQ